MGSDNPAASAGGGAASGPVPVAAAVAVCCMCGDRGLLPELFRCAACAVRSQHTYCTERYPKADSYGTCNWCLRADDQGGNGGGATSTSARSSTARVAGDPASGGGGGRSVPPKVAARGNFATDLSKPIKKPPPQRRILLRRSASDVGSRVRDAPPSPGVARGRPRVRRYKLLEEVITTS